MKKHRFPAILSGSLLLVFLLFSQCGGINKTCRLTGVLIKAIVTRSGAPPKAELRAIEAREQEFLHECRNKKLLIYAVNILGNRPAIDSAGAVAMQTQLAEIGIQNTEIFSEPLNLPFRPQPNEAAIFWERAQAFQGEIVHIASASAYVLMIDVFGNLRAGKIAAVHGYVATPDAQLAYINLYNSHHDLFRQVAPQTVSDACRLIVEDLKSKLP